MKSSAALFFVFAFVINPLLTRAQDRMISHVSGSGGGFNTTVILENLTDTPQDIHLIPYAQAGAEQAMVSEMIPGSSIVSFSVSQLFGTGAEVSHFRIDAGDGAMVSVAYRVATGPGSQAHVQESPIQAQRWRLHPGNWQVVFDGIAAVNTGDAPADVRVRQVAYSGNIVQVEAVFADLSPNAKGLFVIGAPQGSAFTAREDSYFEVISDQPLAMTALRGTPPGASVGYLWENVAIPLDPDDDPPSSGKFDKWLQFGYFRGFDVGYWCDESDCTLGLEDFQDLKATGANLAQLNLTEGLVNPDPPYAANQDGIDALDAMVGFCRQVGLNYTVAVRVGPGRQDVAAEDDGEVPASTIWTNTQEQQLYGDMLRDLVLHLGSTTDPLFVGLNMIVEPNPFTDAYDTPEDLGAALTQAGIDVNALYADLIAAVRAADPNLPVIVQSVYYSNPEFWGLLQKQSDPYVIYDFHSYTPYEYTHGEPANSQSYPGTYWNTTRDDFVTYDKAFYRDVVFSRVRAFQNQHGVPVLMGEFGLMLPQNGGVQYLQDLNDIAVSNGWHFALWTYRPDLDPGFMFFHPENWGGTYWSKILGFFDGSK